MDNGREQIHKKIPRIHFLDELRGFAVLCMIFQHAFLSLGMVLNISFGYHLFAFFSIAEPLFWVLFIGISGISSCLSHSNIKRGLILLCIALGITAVTVLILPSFGFERSQIYFGILHFLAIAILIFAFVRKGLDKIPIVIGIAVNLILFVLTYPITNGVLGIAGVFDVALPKALYHTGVLFPFGIITSNFYSADYFPIFPWIFVFVAGTFLGMRAAQGRFPKWTYRSRAPFLQWMGKHALIIYILHQPVIWGIFYIIRQITVS